MLLKASIVMLLITVVALVTSTTLSELWAIVATVVAAFSAVGALFLYALNRSSPAT